MTPVDVVVNGEARTLPDPSELLVMALRGFLGLTGTKIGCESSTCGACTVLLDGDAVKSCALLVGQVQGRQVTTIEGISTEGLTPIQEAFRDEHGLQCGFCTPGFIVSATALLTADPDPDITAIGVALEGNLCRCTGYTGVVAAVQRAAALLRGETPAVVAGTALAEPLVVVEATHRVGEAADVEVV